VIQQYDSHPEHIEAHDSHHQAEPDLLDKGLSHGSVGLLSSMILGISQVAPPTR
jgi:hypothetical protein